MIIIGDIAGQHDALMRLVNRFPDTKEIILVGDLVDRGPYSAEVIQWAMTNPRVKVIKGNHEHMMIDYWDKTKIYDPGVWEMNGGNATILSYDRHFGNPRPPESHMNWLRNLPQHIKTEDLLVTHAPLHQDLTLERALFIDKDILDFGLMWNRAKPKRLKHFQVFGHNSHWGLKYFADHDGMWGVCIDQSRKQVLTALHYPSLEIAEEPYLQSQKEAGV